MSIPPSPGPHQPQDDPYRPPQPPDPYPRDPFAPPKDPDAHDPHAPHAQGPYPQGPYGPQGHPAGAPGHPANAGHPGHPGYPGPYPQAPYGGAPYPGWGQGYSPYGRPAAVNGLAVAALVLGILCFVPTVGLVLGVVALAQIRKRGERGKGMAVAGAVLSSVGLALWVLALATGGASDFWQGFKDGAAARSGFSLVKGDCFDIPGETFDEEVYDVDEVACSGEHDAEVFATIPLSGSGFPGDDRVGRIADDECFRLRDAYAMDSWALTDEVDVYYLTPTSGSWRAGDREITCVFGPVDDRGTLTGSLRADETTLDADQLAFLKAMAAVDVVLGREPEDSADADLAAGRKWAADTGDVTADQATALGDRAWPAKAGGPVAALAEDMRRSGREWAAAAKATDADAFYEHYETAYAYVDGRTTVTAREALGLATTPPAHDEGSDSGDGGAVGGDGDTGLDV
ncbi:DUF4190 domain-containing protein [Streptomyces sp. NBC_00704]|uniref:DUF4190 domain-containing protein n=1 Tax=Streptomyces sp. NBC_00704 TaxID=2975809 RepID=UPI002E2F696A|nr:DUF4190 domain-containing protein [Streptomyces sp. NBC_00704]